ncbi:UTP--glucose-1-phosphate uridylyltransferase GalU [Aliidiomarina sp. B3213]|nr:UTP--glucose-1-phosphate uridylyltransferase GalU [Aliidiomarina sp. B3213]RTE86094.1 UTP--glucose-1-phosphate uridylyltransferase GalU [Aliidiomarina sp. B3213]TCZ91763.1 UTP--glucose-1-phosphate uridylyltransferase GalU [Lysobacter sp. N42]
MQTSPVKKVVIPVAGLGTRMLPATKAIPKEMLPLVDKPLIQFIVEECAAAGLTDIILVTHASKNSIENHFDTSFELETTLEKRVKRQLLEEVQSIRPPGTTIMHIRQGIARGLGHAVLCAKPIVGNDPFAVVLPDVLIDESTTNLFRENLAQMISDYHRTFNSQILVGEVPWDKVDQYGIANMNGLDLKPGKSGPIGSLVEKPKVSEAPSNLAVIGRYVFSPRIWALLEATTPGAGDEIQLTDAVEQLLNLERVHAHYMTGRSYDCGSKLQYVQAFIAYANRHPELKQLLREAYDAEKSNSAVTANTI